MSVDGGTLAVSGTGSGLFLSRKELTHNTPRKFTGDSVVWTFKWTAPATAGTYHIYAAGNAVNGNGTDDSGDLWNVTTYTITVGPAGPAPKIVLSAPSAIKTRVLTTATTHVTIKNTGDLALTIDHFALKSGAAFILSDTSAHSVAAHDSATIVANFAPTKHQQYVDSLIVFSNDPTAVRASVALIGSGTQGVLRSIPASYDFGQVKLGDTKTTRFVFRNTGDDTLTIESLTAQASTQFTVQSIVPFLTLPAAMLPNDSVVLTLAFQPTLVQKNTMAVLVTLRDIGASRDTSFSISGEGVPTGAVAREQAATLRVYPDPVSTELHISADAPLTSYSVVNAHGVVVDEGTLATVQNFEMSVAKLTPGAYWLRLHCADSRMIVRSFVVK
jgi:hypothetical protein